MKTLHELNTTAEMASFSGFLACCCFHVTVCAFQPEIHRGTKCLACNQDHHAVLLRDFALETSLISAVFCGPAQSLPAKLVSEHVVGTGVCS